jgi:hypothetical protein
VWKSMSRCIIAFLLPKSFKKRFATLVDITVGCKGSL